MRITTIVHVAAIMLVLVGDALAQEKRDRLPERMLLRDGWAIKSSAEVEPDGDVISTERFAAERWYSTTVPSTVLAALIRNGVYPDLRIGLNSFRIPDASDEFNEEHDLAKYSYLPDKRNPWTDPYWYRTEFTLDESAQGKRVWLCFNGLHYRADIWLNGQRVADAQHVVGSFSRYRFDVAEQARFGATNYLAIKAHRMDHPGVPDTQLEVFGKDRQYRKESMKDVGLVMAIGYDCMPTVPDRHIGLWQDVYLEFTGPVDVRDPFVTTRLPLPKTAPAQLTVATELTNTSHSRQEGVLQGRIEETGGRFETKLALEPGETRQVVFSPEEHKALVIENPQLWWPRNYGPQPLYHLNLEFKTAGQISDIEPVTFGIRQITREFYELDGAHGLRVHVNGQRIFCRGGYIQPEILFEWDARRIDSEVRYLSEANLNIVYFEDIPNPPDEFLDACDRYGLMFGNCFYGCYWMQPGTDYPQDTELLARGTADIIKRYRNHPSLVLYMAMNEGETREDVYQRWRKEILAQDGTRLFIPSGSFPDYRKEVPEWIKKDLPVGANDYSPKSYGWVEPAQYFRWVREERNWMFMLESGSASVPPMDSLRKFIPDLEDASPDSEHYPLTPTWAHHGANHYYKPFDEALRKIFGQPRSVPDYCRKAHLLAADQHRAMYEAANHRMWDITSGFSEWKVNACWPTIQWHIYDWFLKPMVSYYGIKKACEPLHVQLTPLDLQVSVVNNHLEPQNHLKVRARVYDLESKLRWERSATADVAANAYQEVFAIDLPAIEGLTPVYFVSLELKDSRGMPVSNNFYWLPLSDTAELARLDDLPTTSLKTSLTTETQGDQTVAHARIEDLSDRLALLVHVALTRGRYGEEAVPVWWEDNYFSLLPGETRELTARLATEDLGGSEPVLEVGGWNVESRFECSRLEASKARVKPGESLVVTATIANTFQDGSPVTLLVDGKPAGSELVWANSAAGVCREVKFPLEFSKPGTHELRVRESKASVVVER